jgi:dTDP-4-dehydrorhamnose reductase
MTRTLILGIDGMLGSSVYKMAMKSNLDFYGTSRRKNLEFNQNVYFFDSDLKSLDRLLDEVQPDYIVNCIGVIKQKMVDSEIRDVEKAININTLLPYFLNTRVEKSNALVIQIATDCVFDGRDGLYTESSSYTHNDYYGLTKRMGEVSSNHFLNLRTSIIGPEFGKGVSLFNWVWKSPPGAVLPGFINHIWNGITTDAFAKVVVGQIKTSSRLSGTQHLIPADVVNKFELVQKISRITNREDLQIVPTVASSAVNRSLATIFPEVNKKLWQNAKFDSPPLISELLSEIQLSEYGVEKREF